MSNPALQTTRSQLGIGRPLLLLLSFLGSFQVMALEVCGFRIFCMAPARPTTTSDSRSS